MSTPFPISLSPSTTPPVERVWKTACQTLPKITFSRSSEQRTRDVHLSQLRAPIRYHLLRLSRSIVQEVSECPVTEQQMSKLRLRTRLKGRHTSTDPSLSLPSTMTSLRDPENNPFEEATTLRSLLRIRSVAARSSIICDSLPKVSEQYSRPVERESRAVAHPINCLLSTE